MTRRTRAVLVALVAAGLSAAVFAGGSPASSSSATADSPLKKACGDRIAIQTDWFPSAERGYLFVLAGLNGTLDAKRGRYSGEIGRTGVQFEIRSGGPFVGYQPTLSLLYQDPSLSLSFANTGDQFQQSAKLPTVSIMAPQEFSPQIIMWNPNKFSINNWNDVRRSGATVVVSPGLDWVDYVLARGFIAKSQIDESYDGAPTRYATGTIIQQGFVSGEPYTYANDVPQTKGQPVKFLLIRSSGYVPYAQNIAVRRSDVASKAACWKLIVPLLQKAQLDYFKNPTPVNRKIEQIVEDMNTFWRLTPGVDAWAAKAMKQYKIVQNGPNCTLGDFDLRRVQGTINQLLPIYKAKGLDSYDPNLKAAAIATNRFINPKIGFKTAKCK